jgi:agmatine deiminase
MSAPPILPAGYRVPAEWEPQEAVSIATLEDEEFDPSQFTGENRTVESVQGAMVRALAGHTKVRLLVRSKESADDYVKRLGVPPSEVEILEIPHCDIWVRDTGPIWARSENGDRALVWMGFNNWGYFPRITGSWAECDIPNYIPRDMGQALGLPVYRTPLVGEGGDKSFNGKGALICCRAVEKDRNPSLSFDQIEELLKRTFNLEKVIWVAQGLADDKQTFDVQADFQGAPLPGRVFTPLTTGGHVDEYCRFVGPSTVLLAEVRTARRDRMTPIEEISFVRMEGNLKLLQEQRDQDGRPLEILRIPLPPDLIYTIDQRDPVWYPMRELRGVEIDSPIQCVLAASYCNFLVSNGVLLMPKYYQPGMSDFVAQLDHDARDVLQRAFPDHRIVSIDVRPVNAGGGGMHCISNDQPR